MHLDDHHGRRRSGVIPFVAALLLLAGCTDFGDPILPPPRPATVTVTSPAGASAELAVGATLQFSATVRDDRGGIVAGAAIGWESAQPSIASIDSSGVARGVNVGSADITATFGALRSVAVRVNVRVGSVAVVHILGNATQDVPVGGALQFQAEARDAADNLVPNALFAWSVDDPLVASIDSTGAVHALVLGQTSVRAASGGFQSSPVLLRVIYNGPDFATRIQPIFESNCIGCHPGNGSLDLTAAASYDNLVSVPALGSPLLRVRPGDAPHSYLYVKITGPCPSPNCSGGRMPFGRPALLDADVLAIHDWIAGGAPR